ncbi:MAG: aryldialkylphosphatase [Microbacterium sp.]|jgi:phosphotriesterase-related protein|nr:aryldialkylphosphatase [Microbacterium sp.]MDF2578779.1 aryldialkylphosphatase [Microbacterium sp.]
MSKTVMSVLGPIDAAQLGPTLPHEHLFIDLLGYVDELERHRPSPFLDDKLGITNLGALRQNPYGNRDNCILDDPGLAVREVARFRELGGRTIVDQTNGDIGSSPELLRQVAEESGVNVIAGLGHYVNFAQKADLAAMEIDAIADGLIDEIENGLAGTTVRPGIIGEIGTTHPIHPTEHKSLRAAARAQKVTDLSIAVHVHPPTRGGHEVLDVLEEEGVDLNRVVLCHLDASLAHSDIELDEAVEYQLELARRGAFIEYDLCGNSGFFTDGANSWWLPSDRERCKGIAALVQAGIADKILISQDVGHKHYLTEFGGWGYAHVLTDFKAMLASFGVDAETHDTITRKNPARMLVGEDVFAV